MIPEDMEASPLSRQLRQFFSFGVKKQMTTWRPWFEALLFLHYNVPCWARVVAFWHTLLEIRGKTRYVETCFSAKETDRCLPCKDGGKNLGLLHSCGETSLVRIGMLFGRLRTTELELPHLKGLPCQIGLPPAWYSIILSLSMLWCGKLRQRAHKLSSKSSSVYRLKKSLGVVVVFQTIQIYAELFSLWCDTPIQN